MSMATTNYQGLDLRSIAEAIAPKRTKFDLFGLVSGYKAYLVYSALEAKSDEELDRIGLERKDIARAAFEAIR